MRSFTRFASVVAAVALVHGTAFGQDLDDVADLSGTWRAPGGSIEIAPSGNGYALSGVSSGKASFDGTSLVFTPDASVGMAGRLAGSAAPAAAPVTFSYSHGDRYDWLVASGVHFYRAHSADKHLDGPWSKPEPQTVNSERVGGLYDNLRDVLGNNDRVANEAPEASLTDARKLEKALAFLSEREAAWGEPVTELAAADFPSEALYDFFRAEKAIELTRFGRTPDDVKDYFLDVSGSVEGNAIAPRKIFCQKWAAKTGPSPVIGAVIPGYRDTVRTFYDEIQLANAAGADMIGMDAQWSGWTQGGHSGGVDSGQGIARDAYAFSGWVARTFPQQKLFLMGSSLGGGPGALGALTLASEGQAEVRVSDGKKVLAGHDLLPASTPAILQAPFLAMKLNFTNAYEAVAGWIPFLKTHEFHSEAKAKNDGTRMDDLKNLLTREDGSASQAEAMDATLRFGKEIVEKIHMGLGPTGPVYVVHAKDDTLAKYSTVVGVVNDLRSRGDDAELTTLDSNHHMFWNDVTEQRAFLPYLAKILGR